MGVLYGGKDALPEGWHHAKKITKASVCGSGGKLLGYYVGPRGKVFFHKADLEEFLGRKNEAASASGRRRGMSANVAHDMRIDAQIQ